jgi:hypothetical protein
MLAELAEGGRGLEADIAAADHRHPPGGRELGENKVDLGPAADDMDSGEVAALALQAPGRSARRPDQASVAEPFAAADVSAFRSGSTRSIAVLGTSSTFRSLQKASGRISIRSNGLSPVR